MKSITILQLKSPTFFASMLMMLLAVSIELMAQPTGLPDAYKADYSVARGGLTIGSLHASLTYSGNHYEYKKKTSATGVAALLTGIKITENTSGQLVGLEVVPKNYYFKQSGRSKSRTDKAEFSGSKAVGSYKGKVYQRTMPKGAQDRASLEVVLSRDIALNKAQLKYTVIERGKLKQYDFQKMGIEKVNTPSGSYNATKVKVVREGKKHETVFWLAEARDYLPVKVQHTENGEVITMLMKKYQKL